MSSRKVFLALLVTVAVGGTAWMLYPGSASDRIYLYPIDTLPAGEPTRFETDLEGEVQVIGGRPAKQGEFAAAFYFGEGQEACSATLIAGSVLLTAGHCVANGASVTLKLGRGWFAKSVDARCKRAPEYNEEKSQDLADYALCRLASEITQTRYFESVNINAERLEAGQDILLTGFGCIRKRGGGNSDRAYYVGGITIAAYNPQNNRFHTNGAVGACTGDSGGAAFLQLDDDESRIQIAVNSSSNNEGFTRLASLSSPVARSFLKRWSEEEEVHICGVHSEATKCYGSEGDGGGD